MTTTAEWDYFQHGRQLYDESLNLRETAHIVDHPSDELLIPANTFLYHDGGQEIAHLSVGMVDYYRCWPCADPHSEAVSDIIAGGSITTPLVVYCDGHSALLGEGNHRLAAAKALGLSLLPVVVIPDRLSGTPDLVSADSEVLAIVDRLARRHHGATAEVPGIHRHQLSTHTVGETVYVFCACGAHWRRSAH